MSGGIASMGHVEEYLIMLIDLEDYNDRFACYKFELGLSKQSTEYPAHYALSIQSRWHARRVVKLSRGKPRVSIACFV